MLRPKDILLPWLLGLITCADTGLATDVAFWSPYASDPHTYALFHLDRDNLADVEGVARMEKVELLGDASRDAAGRFSASLRLHGRGALKASVQSIFPGGYLSIEAWVKLEKLPEKEAYVVFRPPVVDSSPQYNPEVDLSKGFALLIDAQGAFHLETTNCQYGQKTRTSSPEGTVPLGQWVHLAGISDAFPISSRRLYVNGREVLATPIEWGQGITVSGDEERKPSPIYLGNNDRQDAGLNGSIDEVRIHTRIARFWQRDDAWTSLSPGNPVVDGPPYFVESHRPTVYLSLDGHRDDSARRCPNLQIQADGEHFVPGVRGKAWAGPLTLSAPKLLSLREGTLEFWLQPSGVNNYADNNRNFVAGPFILYFLNDGGALQLKPLTLYFPTPNGLHFLYDNLATEMHPGAWYHLAVTWKGKTIALFVNGRQAGKTFRQALESTDNKGLCRVLQFSPNESIGIVDEVRLYEQALLSEEIANAYYRYREPARLVSGVRAKPIELRAQVFPSHNTVSYTCSPNGPLKPGSRIRLRLKDALGIERLSQEAPLTPGSHDLVVSDFGSGLLTLSADVLGADGQVEPGDTFTFFRKPFPWENNTLGITEDIYPPFEPVRVAGNDVHVVERTYTLNGFGLWDKVVALGQDILAAPVRLRYFTPSGEGAWTQTQGRWVSTKPKEATWSAEAVADSVRVDTSSVIAIDGCMKVDLQMTPGANPAEIRKLWIDIPLRSSQVPLMHTIGDGLRQNYAGPTPEGRGVVWDGSKVSRSGPWRNDFTPYVWLGAEQRGLAWFGENDKGWVTEKHKSKTPIHELIRDGDAVVLRVYLINHPVTLNKPRRLCFGLQASPTKPLPADWRRRLPHMPTGLAVVPFGGLECASQGPFRDDWQIVDKILLCRGGQPLDEAWLSAYADRHHPPLVHGNWNWTSSVSHFATRARDVGPNRPLTVYHEEMAASTSRPEYVVFQDEWNAEAEIYDRVQPDPAAMERGYVALGKPVGVTFGPSYRDFGCWYANQWLQRGVSLYWDNTFPHLSTNDRISDAYVTEDGQIQPCLILWNQRAYQQRVWHLLQQWRRKRSEPLEWVLHMTNTLVMPIHTWGTANLDHELDRDEPFSPDWLRTETIGRQVGNLPLTLYPISGSKNKVLAGLSETTAKHEADRLREQVEWGMRVVHEIQHSGPLEKHLADFGYGTDRVRVHNYWDPSPVLAVKPDAVKWIALADPAQGGLLIVLASWSPTDVRAELRLNANQLGFDSSGVEVTDMSTGEILARSVEQPLTVHLLAPYGVRVLKITATHNRDSARPSNGS